jgi:RNA polymerase sigma-70 factor (ECF subfamily)
MQEKEGVTVQRSGARPRAVVERHGAPRDGELLERIKARDMGAFERLYRIYQPRLGRFVTNLVRRPELVEEVLNDTMMAVWNTAGNFRGASRVSTWIFGIAYRQAMKARRRWDMPVEQEPDFEQASTDDGPDELLHQSRRHDALVEAMNELTADHRAVLDLTYFHGMGYREIAAIVGCPVDTVKTRMFHARRKLKRVLAGGLEDWL